MNAEKLFLIISFSAFAWIALLALTFFVSVKVPEKILSEAVKYYSLYMVLACLFLFLVTMVGSKKEIQLDYSSWIKLKHYQFSLHFLIDLLGTTYALLSTVLIGVIFKFSRNYLHREEGYFRFVFLLSVLLFGLIIVSFSRTLDLLFAGWELVGTTSVLLIGYFYHQNQPVKHAFKTIVSYRLCDMGILAAYSWAHLYLHTTDFTVFPSALTHSGGGALFMIGLFVIWASLGKAGQLPMSSWLPTAMEGPTPSSAIFYGALSVHLGPFLLIRMYPYMSHFPFLLILIGSIGFISALYATMVGRTRSDAKTTLVYATISQVGIMYVEIALGFTTFAIFHIVAHASLRTYQFLRSSSIIQDFYENPIVRPNVPIVRSYALERCVPVSLRKRIYIHALNEFHLDFITGWIIEKMLYPFKSYVRWERKRMENSDKILRRLLRKE